MSLWPDFHSRAGSRWLVWPLLLVTVTWGVSVPASRASAVTRVVMIGDSITLAVTNSGIPVDIPYPDQVATMLGPEYSVDVAACGGTRSSNWRPNSFIVASCRDFVAGRNLYARFIADQLPFDVATILLGTNDAIQLVAPWAYEGFIEEIIDGLLADGIQKVFLMIAPQLPTTFGPLFRAQIGYYGGKILDICDTEGDAIYCGPDLAFLLDLQIHFDDLDGWPGRDVHPNSAGHAVIANALYDSIMAAPEPGSNVLSVSALVTLCLLARRRSRFEERG